MDWSHQTVLVTGAGGFIGSHLAERLVTMGARTRALVRYNSAHSWGWIDHLPAKDHLEVVMGDIRESDSLREAMRGADIVFHLAALVGIPYSYQSPGSYVRTNIEGTLNLLQAALHAEVGLVVHTSTSEVYGSAQYVPIDEDHPLQGQSPYSASKIGADKLAEAFHLSFQLPVATVRPFNTFGPRQSARAIVPTIITQALTQPEVRLGDVTPSRDFNYVQDTVEAFIRTAECPQAIGKVLNVGSGREVSIQDLAATVLSLLGKQIPMVRDEERVRPERSEVQRLCADNTRAREMVGWSPSFTLEQGLTQTIEWIDQHLEQYRIGAYAV